jgi:arylformamidase
MSRIIDVTLPVSAKLPVWPGDDGPRLERSQSIATGAPANVSRFASGVHVGTHVDAPVHFIDGGGAVEAMPLETMVGPAVVIEIAGAAEIGPAQLDAAQVPAGTERLLIKTGNSTLWDRLDQPFYEDFAALTPQGACWVVEQGIKLIGIDYLSIQRYRGDPEYATHHTLLGAGIVIVEGLDLRRVAPGRYGLTCLPLKLVGSDGAPARVILTAED